MTAGYLEKVKVEGIWYKYDPSSYSSETEVAISALLDDLQLPHIQYYLHPENNKVCCSKDIGTIHPISSLYEVCPDPISTIPGTQSYLSTLKWLDYIFANPDRHQGNYGVISTPNGLEWSPYFDFGASFGNLPPHHPYYGGGFLMDPLTLRDDLEYLLSYPVGFPETPPMFSHHALRRVSQVLPRDSQVWPWVSEVVEFVNGTMEDQLLLTHYHPLYQDTPSYYKSWLPSTVLL